MTPQKQDGIVCPICGNMFKTVEAVDLHIDNCKVPASYNLRSPKGSTSMPIKQLAPLPTVNYALYNEKQLRALLGKFGVLTSGNKSMLMARHKEYITLYNANIDRRRPQPMPVLLRQMDRWEAAQQATLQKKDIDLNEWQKKRKHEYDELTKLARESAKIRKIGEEDFNKEGPSVIKSSEEETIV